MEGWFWESSEAAGLCSVEETGRCRTCNCPEGSNALNVEPRRRLASAAVHPETVLAVSWFS